MSDFQPGLYQHFKGVKYRALGVARHTESNEEVVVYHVAQIVGSASSELPLLFVRPRWMWDELVAWPVQGAPRNQPMTAQLPRFMRIGD